MIMMYACRLFHVLRAWGWKGGGNEEDPEAPEASEIMGGVCLLESWLWSVARLEKYVYVCVYMYVVHRTNNDNNNNR